MLGPTPRSSRPRPSSAPHLVWVVAVASSLAYESRRRSSRPHLYRPEQNKREKAPPIEVTIGPKLDKFVSHSRLYFVCRSSGPLKLSSSPGRRLFVKSAGARRETTPPQTRRAWPRLAIGRTCAPPLLAGRIRPLPLPSLRPRPSRCGSAQPKFAAYRFISAVRY